MTHNTTSLDRLGENLRGAQGSLPELPAVFRELLARLNDPPSVHDDGVFGKQLTALRPRLRSYAQSLTRDRDRADDLVQDTMLRAWAARARFEEGTNMGAWTHTILRNLFKSAHRRARFVGDYDEIVAEHRLAGEGNQVATVELAEVTQAIGCLSPEQQEALTLIAIEGLSYEEAATRTGTLLGTLKSRVARARMAIEAMLDGDQPRTKPSSAKAIKPEPAPGPVPKANARGAWAAAKASNQTLWIG